MPVPPQFPSRDLIFPLRAASRRIFSRRGQRRTREIRAKAGSHVPSPSSRRISDRQRARSPRRPWSTLKAWYWGLSSRPGGEAGFKPACIEKRRCGHDARNVLRAILILRMASRSCRPPNRRYLCPVVCRPVYLLHRTTYWRVGSMPAHVVKRIPFPLHLSICGHCPPEKYAFSE